MKSEGKPKIIVICGPTATGKSDYAVALAHKITDVMHTVFDVPSTGEGTIKYDKSQVNGPMACEIVSADSRQIYKYLDIGTGKIAEAEMRSVPHHLLDIREPLEIYSVIDYKKDCETAIAEILAKGRIPILCGGTGFYIDTVTLGVTLPEVSPNEPLRKELESMSQDDLEKRFDALWEVAVRDHNQKQITLDKKNPRRLMRAIEIMTALGHIPAVESNPPYDAFYIGLDANDDTLKDRIKKRIDKRLEATSDMIAESEALLAGGKLNHERMQKLGLEYAFISDYIKFKSNIPQTHENPDDEITSFDTFKEKLFYAIWHYAKRQRTWFRRNKDIHWIQDPQSHEGLRSAQEIEAKLFEWLKPKP